MGGGVLSSLVIAYLFLGGTGAGCAFACSLLGILAEPISLDRALASRFAGLEGRAWMRLFAIGYLVAIGCLGIGAVCLLADLGQPARMLMVLFPPKVSYLSLGAWSIVVCICFCAVMAAIWSGAFPVTHAAIRVLGVFGLVECLVVMVYTGLLLSSMAGVPIWNTGWLVVLFCLSSLSCGIAALMLVSSFSDALRSFPSALADLTKVDAVLIVCECLVLFVSLLGIVHLEDTAAMPDETARAAILSMNRMVFGDLAAPFWFVLIGIGLVVPFALECGLLRMRASKRGCSDAGQAHLIILGSSASVLVGGAVLRWLVVAAAVHPSLFTTM